MEVRRGRVLLEAGDVDGRATGVRVRARRAARTTPRRSRPSPISASPKATGRRPSRRSSGSRACCRRPKSSATSTRASGELYSHHLLNLPRAEVALKEVLKRAPDDAETTEKLVDVYKRQNDAARAIELQQELVQKSRVAGGEARSGSSSCPPSTSKPRRTTARPSRRSKARGASSRRTWRSCAPSRSSTRGTSRRRRVNILLDRAGADARRALTAGRLVPASFESPRYGVRAAREDGRGAGDVRRCSRRSRAGPSICGARASSERSTRSSTSSSPPRRYSQPMRALLAKTGDALDAVAPVDLRTLQGLPHRDRTRRSRASWPRLPQPSTWGA